MPIVNSQFIEALLGSISEGILVVDQTFKIVYVNEALISLFGYSNDELVGNDLSVLIPKELRKGHVSYTKKYANNPSKQKMSERDGIYGRAKNRDLIPIEIGLNHFKNGGESYSIAIISDITQVKRTNQFLQDLHYIITSPLESGQLKIQSILDLGCNMFNLPIGILSKIDGDDYRIVEISADLVYQKEMLAQNLFHVDHTYCRDVIDNENPIYIPHASKTKEHTHPCYENLKLETFIGAKVMVEEKLYGTINFSSPNKISEDISKTDLEILKLMAQWIGNMLRQENLILELHHLNSQLESKVESRTEELKYALSEIQDINNSLKLEVEKRIDAERTVKASLENEKKLNVLKSRFVSTASHEFRTPLTGILSSVALIEKYADRGLDEKRNKHINIIRSSVKNLTNILNDLLSINKIESGKVDCNPVHFNIDDLINEVKEEMNLLLKDGQQILVDADKISSIKIYQDIKLLKNVLINLLSNAIKYSDENKPIKVTVELNEPNLSISVKDSGIGIPKEDQVNLFERFFRASNASGYQGTGLGLNITKNYITLMQGEMNYESDVNIGSTFRIKIPSNYKTK